MISRITISGRFTSNSSISTGISNIGITTPVISSVEINEFQGKIDILSKDASDYVKTHKEVYDFLNESYDVLCSKKNLWKATLESFERDGIEKAYKFKIFIGETRLPAADENDLRLFSLRSKTVYDEILDLLLDKSKETYKSVVLDESYL